MLCTTRQHPTNRSIIIANAIPIIRAGVIVPILRWLREAGRDVAVLTSPFDLPADAATHPLRPISLIAAIQFLASLSDREGADLPFRVISDIGILEVASLAPAVREARTARDILTRVAQDFPRHATHEFFSFDRVSGGMAIRDGFALQLPPEAIHAAQSFEAALMHRVLGWSGLSGPYYAAVEMVPHPSHGVAHASAALGITVSPAAGRRFSAVIPDHILDAPSLLLPRLPLPEPAPVLHAPDLRQSVRLLLREMLLDGTPSLERLILASARSRRTLQRQFLEEGVSFKSVLDEVRREEALGRLSGTRRVTDVAAELGYASPSGLTRAVRRWTSQPPRRLLRSNGEPAHPRKLPGS